MNRTPGDEFPEHPDTGDNRGTPDNSGTPGDAGAAQITALRAEVAGLRADLTALARHLGALQTRLDPTRTTASTVPVAATSGPAGAVHTSGAPSGWADRADVGAWTELADWVAWLHTAYDLAPARAVAPCWPAHPGAVEELAALRDAWQTATAVAATTGGGEAMISWHERRLHPCLARLREVYQLTGCAEGHRPPRPARPTDPALLTAAISTAPRRAADTAEPAAA